MRIITYNYYLIILLTKAIAILWQFIVFLYFFVLLVKWLAFYLRIHTNTSRNLKSLNINNKIKCEFYLEILYDSYFDIVDNEGIKINWLLRFSTIHQ